MHVTGKVKNRHILDRGETRLYTRSMKVPFAKRTFFAASAAALAACLALTACPSGSETDTPAEEKSAPATKTTEEGAEVSTPADGGANDTVKRLMAAFAALYGNGILSGQMDCSWSSSIDMVQKVQNDTGALPVIKGFDFMDDTNAATAAWGNSQVSEAIDWWKEGGLVAYCWHWRNPASEEHSDSDKSLSSYKPDETDFRIPWKNGALDTESEAFSQLKADVDIVAGELQKLQDAGVAVLWRPLHEAAGDPKYKIPWFWWGYAAGSAAGSTYTDDDAAAYRALWKWLFSYLTNEKGLHNLVWVWNGQSADYYPGDAYVDILGYDCYETDHGSQKALFDMLTGWSDSPATAPKMAALTECGCIPASNALMADGAKWLYFMVWNDDDNLADDTNDGNDNFWGGTAYNSTADKTTNSYGTDYVKKRGGFAW